MLLLSKLLEILLKVMITSVYDLMNSFKQKHVCLLSSKPSNNIMFFCNLVNNVKHNQACLKYNLENNVQ